MKADTKQAIDKNRRQIKTGDKVYLCQTNGDYFCNRAYEVIEHNGEMYFAVDAESLFNGEVVEVERL